MSKSLRVTVVGATGETGASIVNALIDSPQSFDITTLARPSSVNKPEYKAFRDKGVKVASADLETVNDETIALLSGMDAVVSCLTVLSQEAMKNLAIACHKAGVKRFVPSFFGPVCPPRGVMMLRDTKEDLLDQIKAMYLPYTVIDVGWWCQISLPPLPSGKIDDKVVFPVTSITGDGNTPSAYIDNRDIGRYVAHIIADPRTLNKSVFIYNEILTQNKIFDLLEKLSGEKIPRNKISGEELQAKMTEIKKASGDNAGALQAQIGLMQYDYSRLIRGDNMPETAKYLGYLDGKELYPDIQGGSLEDYVKGILDGSIERPYAARYQ